MNYLLIQNPGVAPVEGYLTLGLSTTRDCGVDGTIGQFGSGAKHAINLLLRSNIKVIVYCGKTRLDFYIEERVIDDGLSKKTIQQVMCKLGGTSTRTHDCGWCLDFGSIDWNDTAMALREFVSNAIDRTIRERKEFRNSLRDGDLRVSPMDEDGRKARDGFTRVYVELTPEVQRFYGELPKRFLHFGIEPDEVYQTMLPKADRNLGNSKTAVIYRNGVMVREIAETVHQSLFDYNFPPASLPIDECRNSSEYATRAGCAKLLKKASTDNLAVIFGSLLKGEETFESSMDPYYLCPTWDAPGKEQKQEWQSAWSKAAGDAVACDDSKMQMAEYVQRKGHKVETIKATGWVEAVGRFGIKTAGQVLDANEQKGRIKQGPTEAALKAVDIVWGWLEDLKMTQGMEKPQVGCYRDIMDAGCEVLGFQEGNSVYIREDIASAVNKFTLKVALEEVVHYVTGATDGSRDLQQFLFDIVVEIAA